jgi:hypothetical protein
VPGVPADLNAGALLTDQNTITVRNKRITPQRAAVFENPQPSVPSFDPITTLNLVSGEAQTVVVHAAVEGRVQRYSAPAHEPATWGELRDNGWQNETWVDVSYIRGNDGPMVISSLDGSMPIAGTAEDLIAACSGGVVSNSAGVRVLDATEPYSGGVNDALVACYRAHGNGNGYVRNFDNDAVRATPNHHIVVDLY